MKKPGRILPFTVFLCVTVFPLFWQLHGKDIDILHSHRVAFQALPQQEEVIFLESRYGACFFCHEPAMAHDENAGETRTRFRDLIIGKNLHALHLQRQPRGTNCTGCHAAGEPAVVFTGGVRLIRSRNGGSCQPSCHRPKKYRNGP